MPISTLICTVGGSHQPIVKAIQQNQPDFVWFICSEDDSATGRPGSWQQIRKEGVFIKENFFDDMPTLPNIPTQLNLSRDQYDLIKIQADDLNIAYRAIYAVVQRSIDDEQSITIDYTGGTKTMSAALCMAALEFPEVRMQLVTGARADLKKVQDGTEQPTATGVVYTGFRQGYMQALQAWQTYHYQSAAVLLKRLKSMTLRDESDQRAAIQLSHAFAAWDRFAYRDALLILEREKGECNERLGPYLTQLNRLVATGPEQEAAVVQDLWLNAKRRASEEKFDDAIIRVYKLLEGFSRLLLGTEADISTSDIDGIIRRSVPISTGDTKRQHQSSFLSDWKMLKQQNDKASDIHGFIQRNNAQLQELNSIYNNALLVQGCKPVTQQAWLKSEVFMEQQFIPFMQESFLRFGYKTLSLQLPTRLPSNKQ